MEKEQKGGEESSQIQEDEGLQRGGESETVTKNEPKEPLIVTEVGSEGHISEVVEIIENGQNSSGISEPPSSVVEPKGNNYYPMVNFKNVASRNSPSKENQKIVQYKELKSERKSEYNLRPRVSRGKNEYISTGGLSLNLDPKPQIGRKSFLSKAQKRAISKIKQGKQGTILRALRDVGPRGVIK